MREATPELRLSQTEHAQDDHPSSPALDRQPALRLESTLHLSLHSSTASLSPSPSSPMTPALSIKGHARLSSGSGLASSPPIRASMDSYMSKRPLTQLREDPEELDLDMPDLAHAPSQSSYYEDFPSYDASTNVGARFDLQSDYDWEHLPYDSPSPISFPKRRRAERSTPSMISTKIAQRFPSISRRFRSTSEKRTSSIADSLHEVNRSRSRAGSMRSTMTKESFDNDDLRDVSHLPTPAPSFIEEEPAEVDEFADFDEVAEEPAELIEADTSHPLTRTPLLPPVLAIRPESTETIQSPLQSPKVVETTTSPPSPNGTALHTFLPSPPLSTKASVASFHHRSIVPASEIPTMVLAEPLDEWAIKLGHANFNIEPEPYLPHEPTVEACRKLKADWEEAEHHFGRHLARTRAVYSSTSKIAQLTEDKWAAINALWKSNHEQVLASIMDADALEDSVELSKQPSLHEPVPVTRIPSHLVGGKFPAFGDKGIVGPMEVAKPLVQHLERSQHQRTPSKKRAFWKFIQDLLPGALVRTTA